MIYPAASTLLVDSVLLGAISSQPIGSEAFTVSMPAAVTQKSDVLASRTQPIGNPDRHASSNRAKVRISDLLDAFKACVANDLVWIEDFCDDEAEISRDLYEVLEAFAQIRRQDVGEN